MEEEDKEKNKQTSSTKPEWKVRVMKKEQKHGEVAWLPMQIKEPLLLNH